MAFLFRILSIHIIGIGCYVVLYLVTAMAPALFLQTNNVSVGKMDIVWRSRFGERGRIQTGQLKAVVNMGILALIN